MYETQRDLPLAVAQAASQQATAQAALRLGVAAEDVYSKLSWDAAAYGTCPLDHLPQATFWRPWVVAAAQAERAAAGWEMMSQAALVQLYGQPREQRIPKRLLPLGALVASAHAAAYVTSAGRDAEFIGAAAAGDLGGAYGAGGAGTSAGGGAAGVSTARGDPWCIQANTHGVGPWFLGGYLEPLLLPRERSGSGSGSGRHEDATAAAAAARWQSGAAAGGRTATGWSACSTTRAMSPAAWPAQRLPPLAA